LATQLSDSPREAALELARDIAQRPPEAIRAGKALLDASGLISVEEGLQLEERLQKSLLGSRNQIEAVRAVLEKREPEFQDPE